LLGAGPGCVFFKISVPVPSLHVYLKVTGRGAAAAADNHNCQVALSPAVPFISGCGQRLASGI